MSYIAHKQRPIKVSYESKQPTEIMIAICKA